jgi:GMP synthase-like glutamine amidotransferase
MNSPNEPLKIAILCNGYESPKSSAERASFVSAITAASSFQSISSSPSHPTIDFFDPIVAQEYPKPEDYDLIVLSGGTADPMGQDPWVLKMQNFLRTTVSEHPKQKLVAICWGHQTMCVSFGGKVASMDSAEIGVVQLNLTAEGKKMYPFATEGKIHMHEYHRREIKVPAKGFVPLAEGYQSFMNEAKTILTFQGHPEMNQGLAETNLRDAPSYMGVDDAKREVVAKTIERSHDGVLIWKRILEWVKE